MRNIISYKDLLSNIERIYQQTLDLPLVPQSITVHPADRDQFISIFERTMTPALLGYPSLINIPVHFDSEVKQGYVRFLTEDEVHEYPLRNSDG